MKEGYKPDDLIRIALNNKELSIKKGLETYANPDNWIQFYDKENAKNLWVWNGPTICAHELAMQCLKYDINDNSDRKKKSVDKYK